MTIVEIQGGNVREDSLLGEPTSDLRLRVSWDSGRTGEVIHVGAQKATIGSDSGSTVWLADADVAPLECLVLRGAAHSVVRWFDAGAVANGGDVFEDELLTAGDQLQIGRAELEILGGTPTPDLATIMGPDVGGYAARLECLERQLAELQRNTELGGIPASEQELENASAREIELTDELQRVQQLRTEELEHWNAERRDLEQLVAVQSADITGLRVEVEALQEDLQVIRAEQAELKPAAEEQAELLAAARRELSQREQGESDREQAWQRERQQLETRLEENQQQMAAFADELAETRRQTSDLQATYEDAQVRIQELATQVEETEAEFATSQDAWERERTETQQQLTELADQAKEAEESAATDAAEREREVERLREQIAQGPEQLSPPEPERQDPFSTRDDSTEDLQTRLEQPGLEAFGEGGQHEPEQAAGELMTSGDIADLGDGASADDQRPDDNTAGVASPMDRFLSATSLIDDEDQVELGAGHFQNDFSASPEPLEEPSDQMREATSLSAAYGSGLDRDVADATPTGLVGDYGSPAMTEEPEPDEASDRVGAEQPVSTADVLAKLGQSVSWSDDDEAQDELGAPATAATSYADRLDAEPGQRPEASSLAGSYATSTQSPATLLGTAADSGPAASDEDESIEDYMTRLLNRARGGDAPNEDTPDEPAVAPGPIAECKDVTASPAVVPEEPAATIEMKDYKPTRQAPEAAAKLDAMRELANETRRTAIASHAKRNWSSVMKLKLMVSIFAAIAVSASFIFFWGNPVALTCGVVAGLAVLGYWGWLAKTYRKLLIESLMLDTSRHSPTSAD